MMTIFLFSVGIPSTIGFIGKLYVFTEAINAGYVGLTIVAIFATIVSVYYYFRLIAMMYFYPPKIECRTEEFNDKRGERADVARGEEGAQVETTVHGPDGRSDGAAAKGRRREKPGAIHRAMQSRAMRRRMPRNNAGLLAMACRDRPTGPQANP